MTKQNITNFRAFWPLYVREHRDKTNRNIQFLGISLALFFLYHGLTQPWFLPLAIICRYGFAWGGHKLFEKIQPTIYRKPLWCIRADARFFLFMCAGRMDREVRRMDILARNR